MRKWYSPLALRRPGIDHHGAGQEVMHGAAALVDQQDNQTAPDPDLHQDAGHRAPQRACRVQCLGAFQEAQPVIAAILGNARQVG